VAHPIELNVGLPRLWVRPHPGQPAPRRPRWGGCIWVADAEQPGDRV